MGVATCIKYTMILFNSMFALIGLAIIGLGTFIYLTILNTNYSDLYGYIVPAVIAIGCVTFFVAFCGCCGAWTENHSLLVTYGIAMFLLMIVKVALVIFIFVKMSTWISDFENVLIILKNKKTLKFMEYTFRCCGVRGAYETYGLNVPSVCCAKNTYTCTNLSAYPGCLSSYQYMLNVIGYSLAGGAVFQLIALIAGLYLANHVRKGRLSRF